MWVIIFICRTLFLKSALQSASHKGTNSNLAGFSRVVQYSSFTCGLQLEKSRILQCETCRLSVMLICCFCDSRMLSYFEEVISFTLIRDVPVSSTKGAKKGNTKAPSFVFREFDQLLLWLSHNTSRSIHLFRCRLITPPPFLSNMVL